jgi:hypothetical protein
VPYAASAVAVVIEPGDNAAEPSLVLFDERPGATRDEEVEKSSEYGPPRSDSLDGEGTMTKTKKVKMRVSQGELAKHDIKAVHDFAKALGLQALMSEEEFRATTAGIRAPTKLLELACAAWDQYGTLTGVQSFDSDGGRVAVAYRAAREPMVAALETLHKQAAEDVRRKYASHGQTAIALYKTMRAASTTKEGAVMKSDVAAMEAVMSRPRKPKDTTSQSSTTTTTTKTMTKGKQSKSAT